MWIVEYYEGAVAQYFLCDQADDQHHAREQCMNANPECSIARIGVIRWIDPEG